MSASIQSVAGNAAHRQFIIDVQVHEALPSAFDVAAEPRPSTMVSPETNDSARRCLLEAVETSLCLREQITAVRGGLSHAHPGSDLELQLHDSVIGALHNAASATQKLKAAIEALKETYGHDQA